MLSHLPFSRTPCRAAALALTCAMVVAVMPAAAPAKNPRASSSTAPVDIAAPHFRSADGATHTLAELRGHPAVVNFWATWCGPCREEMPRLQKLADAYRGREVQFVTISLDAPDTEAKIPAVLARRNLRLPVWLGADEHTLAALQLGELVPATLILDDTGEAIGHIEGESSEKDIRSRLDWLLNGRAGKPPKPVQKNDW